MLNKDSMSRLMCSVKGPLCQHRFLLFISLLLLLIIMASELDQRTTLIEQNLPYAVHSDEGYLLEPAKNMLEKGDFNPHNFNYPSLPFYLTALGMTSGYLANITDLDVGESVIENGKHVSVGRTHYPFYALPNVVKKTKELFALLSVLSLLCIGFIAYKAFKNLSLLALPAAFLALSNFYLHQSWYYLNVDILAAFFSVFFYACLYGNLDKDTYLKRAIIPGLVAGLAIACKYTFYPLALVAPLAIVLLKCDEKYLKAGTALIATVIAFLLASPYILLDYSTALYHILGQVMHYKMGHGGHNVTPGVEHLSKYIHSLTQDYGWFILLLAALGLIWAFLKHWKHALILLSFPLMLLLYMSNQKVNFTRNITVIYTMMPIFSAMGLVCAYQCLNTLSRFSLLKVNTPLKIPAAIVSGVLLAGLLVSFAPVERFYTSHNVQDTRISAANWINNNIPANSAIIIDEALGFDNRTLQSSYNIGFFDLKTTSNPQLGQLLGKLKNAYFIIPDYQGQLGPSGDISHQRLAKFTNDRVAMLFKEATPVMKFGTVPIWYERLYRPYWGGEYVDMSVLGHHAQFTLYHHKNP